MFYVTEAQPAAPPAIPGLDFSSSNTSANDRLVTRKKIPYSKPIPKQFEMAWEEGKQPALLGDVSNIIRNPGPGHGPPMGGQPNGPRGLLENPPMRGPGPDMQGPRQGKQS